ncbi:ferric reductase-like transmembrane domain-containing protein [Fodinibius sediminis]|nr:ferric reductase-like transmembrane domain-containing protein [Fodinibius sediminis]
MYRWSMASGYVGLALLVITLILGPAKLLSGKRYPRSNDLRRDFGIWSAIIGLIHVVVGIQVHMGNPWLYFFLKDPFPQQLVLRGDLFGFANYTGLVAALILLFLLLLSNDLSMKKLGGKRWKNLQRWSYGIFLFVIAHSIAYQVIEERKMLYLIIFSLLALITVTLQLVGFFKWRSTN